MTAMFIAGIGIIFAIATYLPDKYYEGEYYYVMQHNLPTEAAFP
jgi:hypothetical protein